MATSRKSRFAMLDGSLLARKGHARPAIPLGNERENAIQRADIIADAEAHHGVDVEHNLAELIVRPRHVPDLEPGSFPGLEAAVEDHASEGHDAAGIDVAPSLAPVVDAEPPAELNGTESPLSPEARFGLMPRTWPGRGSRRGPAISPRGLNGEQAARYVGVPRRTFTRLVRDGTLPGPMPFSGDSVWDRKVLDLALDRLSGIDASAVA